MGFFDLFNSKKDVKEKQFDIDAQIKKIQSNTSMDLEGKRALISEFCVNANFSVLNPLIDRYPLDLTSRQGNTQQKIMLNLINYFRQRSGLTQIYGGYAELKEPLHSFSTIGRTSLAGMNIDQIINDLKSGINLALCYIAIPIDESDYLIERPSMTDWDFQESIVDSYLGCSTVPIGSISGKNIQGRLRTLKWTWNIDS